MTIKSPKERLMSKVTIADNGCWIWHGCKNNGGYGVIGFRGRQTTAHRVSYIVHGGAVTENQVVDHLCRNRACVNPLHLEAVSQLENTNRGQQARGIQRVTHCVNGHEYTPENTYFSKRSARGGRPYRFCKTCHQLRRKRLVAA